jgi:hypothetical protein
LQSSTNVSFSLSIKTGSMEIYDIHGRLVVKLPVNNHLTTWQGNHSSGRYFTRVVDGGMNIVKPFMVMR